MLDFFNRALLISFYPPLLLFATFFIFLMGYIYGYAVSFIFGMKKTLVVGFFVVVLGVIFILIFSGAYILATQCTVFNGVSECDDSMSLITRALSSLMLLLSHLFINIILGHLGVAMGIAFYFPSEWFLNKFTKVTLPKKSVEEYEAIQRSQQTMTTGTITLPDTSGKNNFEKRPDQP